MPLNSDFVILMQDLTITEEVTLELARIRFGTNAPGGSTFLQIYRPYCPENYTYCYWLNKCLASGQVCANVTNKVNCIGGLVYRLSTRSCINFNSTTSGIVKSTLDFTTYYIFLEVKLESTAGNFSYVSTSIRATLLPGDVPAIYGYQLSILVKSTQNRSCKIQTSQIMNFANRTTGIGKLNLSNSAVTPVNYTPLVQLTLVKPAYYALPIVFNSDPLMDETCCHSPNNYTVSVNVINDKSFVNVSAPVTLYIPISNISMYLQSIVSSFQVTAVSVQLIGSLPVYTFSTNDSSLGGSWTTVGGGGNYSYVNFTHYYASSGPVNVSLTASNLVSSASQFQIITVQNAIAGLSVWPVKLLGQDVQQPSQFNVFFSQGSAARVAIDYGDGKADTITVDDANAFRANDDSEFFVAAANMGLDETQCSPFQSRNISDCFNRCLKSTFPCMSVSFNESTKTCYLCGFRPDPTAMNFTWSSNRVLYLLKNDTCNFNLIQAKMFSHWNATSKNDDNADLSGSGWRWTSVSSKSESLQLTFTTLTQIYAMNISYSGSPLLLYSFSLSNDSIKWVTYANYSYPNTTFNPVGATPIVTRFLRIEVFNAFFYQTQASIKIGVTGCLTRTVTQIFSHNYSIPGVYTVTVIATNAVSNQIVTYKHFVDRQLTNISVKPTANNVAVNSSIVFVLTGVFGQLASVVVQGTDGTFSKEVLQFNTISRTYNFKTIPLLAGVFFYNITVSNWLGSVVSQVGPIYVYNVFQSMQILGNDSLIFPAGAKSISLPTLLICLNSTFNDRSTSFMEINYGDDNVTSLMYSCNQTSTINNGYLCNSGFKVCGNLPSFTFSTTGVKVIKVALYNNISRADGSFHLNIWEEIKGLTTIVEVQAPFPAGMTVFDTCYPVNRSLKFTAQVTSGANTPVTYVWSFGDGSPVITNTSATIFHTYKSWSNNYNVTLTASNPLSSVTNSIMRSLQGYNNSNLCVLVPVSADALTFTNDGPAIVNSTFNFTFSISTPSPVRTCYMIDFADPLDPNAYQMWGDLTECANLAQFSPYMSKSVARAYSTSSIDSLVPLRFSHGYFQIGRYTATLYAGNRVSAVTVPIPVVVSKQPCFLPNVTVGALLICTPTVNCNPQYDNKIIQYWRSSSINIASNVIQNCVATPWANYSWWINVCKDRSCASTTPYSALGFPDYVKHYNVAPVLSGLGLKTISFLPRAFKLGLYQVCLNVSMVDQDGLWTVDCGLFSVVNTPSVTACINNSATVVTGLFSDDNFKLDASCSADPDNWPEEDQGLTFEWSCYRKCESQPKYDKNGNFIPWDDPDNSYYTTCPSFDNNSQPISNEGCFAPFGVHKSGPIDVHAISDWKSSSLPQNPLYNAAGLNIDYIANKMILWYMPNASTLVLNSGTMFYEQQFFILLTTRKGSSTDRWQQSAVIVTFSGVLPPKCTLYCVSNCYPKAAVLPTDPLFIVDPGSALKLTGSISNYSPLISYTYKWYIIFITSSLTLSDLGQILLQPENYTTSYDFTTYSSTSNNKLGLSLDKRLPIFNSTAWGKNVLFLLQISSQGVSGNTFILGAINVPPRTDSCTVNPTPANGSALSTQFQFTCKCNYSADSIYYYALGYAVGAKNTYNNHQNTIATSKTCVWLVSGVSTCAFTSGTVLPAGSANDGNLVSVCVGVTDVIGSTNYTFLQTIIVKLNNANTAAAVNQLSNPVALTDLVQTNLGGALGLMMATASILTVSPSNATNASSVSGGAQSSSASKVSNAQLQSLAESVVNAVSSIAMESAGLQTILQVGHVLAAFTVNPAAVTSSTASMAASTLQKMASVLNSASQSSDNSYNDLMSTASSLFTATAQIATATQTSAQSSNSSSSSSSSAGSSTSAAASNAQQSTAQLKSSYSALQSTIDSISTALASRKVVDEGPTQLSSSTMVLTLQTKSSKTFTNALVQPSDSTSCTSFEFGSENGVLSKMSNDTPQSASYQHTVSAASMFTWQQLASDMNSETSMTLIQASGNRNNINVTSTPPGSEFIIWIDTGVSPDQIGTPYPANKTLAYTTPKSKPMLMHSVTVKAHSALFVSVRQYVFKEDVAEVYGQNTSVFTNSTSAGTNRNSSVNNGEWPTINGSYEGTNVRFIVYVSSQPGAPTDTNYQFSCNLPIADPSELHCGRPTDWPQAQTVLSTVEDLNTGLKTPSNIWWNNLTATANTATNKCNRVSKRTRDPYTCMFPESLLNLTNTTTFRIGVRAIQWNGTFNASAAKDRDWNTSRPTTSLAKPNISESDKYLTASYVLLAYPSACFFYNSTIDNYDNSGCTVGGCSSLYATQCTCTHLTSFSNVFSLPSVKFDVTAVNLNALNDSPGVALFLVAIMCLYCIVWVWARRRDLHDLEGIGVVPLPSNNVKDTFGYEVTVWTGHAVGSGTTARVSCVIAGDEAETPPRYLHNVHQNAFTRGSQRTMLLTTQVWLGQLSHVRVWHDNTGSSPHWYFSRMLIRDIYTGAKYYFLANTWLAVDRGLGTVDHFLPVAGKQELRGFEHVFWTQSTNQMFDGHVWLSVVTRPQRSRFTRVQRITCCLMMCYSSIVFNLLGYIVKNSNSTTSTSDTDAVLMNIGPIKITSWTFTVSCIAAAATVPVNLIVLLLFKERAARSKPDAHCSNQDKLSVKYKTADEADPDSKANARSKAADSKNDDDLDLPETCLEQCSACLSRHVRTLVKKMFPLPWYTHRIAYGVTLVVTAVCWFCTLVLAYSNLTAEQMDGWLQAIVLALLLNIFIVQPLQIVLIVALFALILREPVDDHSNLSNQVLTSEASETQSDGSADIVDTSSVAPPNKAIIEGLRKKVFDEKDSKRVLLHAVGSIIIYLFVLIGVYVTATPSVHRQTAEVVQSLTPRTTVLSESNLYAYLRTQVLPYLYTSQLGQNFSSFAADGVSYVVAAYLRQMRLKPNSDCAVPDYLASVVPTCTGQLDALSVDSAHYGANWTSGAGQTNDSSASAFRYTAVLNPLVISAAAMLGAYPTGAGYVADLGRNFSQANYTLSQLAALDWLDNRTRLLFVDLLMYNVQTRLFTASFSHFELLLGIRYKPEFYSINLDPFSSATGSFTLLMQVIAAVILFLFAMSVFNDVCKAKKTVDCSWLDVLVALLSLLSICICVSLYCTSITSLGKLSNPVALLSDLQVTLGLQTVANALLGSVVFLLSLRLIRLLLLSPQFAVVAYALSNFAKASVHFTCLVVVQVFAFTFTFYLLFNWFAADYCCMSRSVVSAWSFIVAKSTRIASVQPFVPLLAPSFFLAYVFLIVFTFMRLTVGLLRSSLQAAKRQHAETRNAAGVFSYVAWKLKELWCCPASTDTEADWFQYVYTNGDIDQAIADFEEKSLVLTKQIINVANCSTERYKGKNKKKKIDLKSTD